MRRLMLVVVAVVVVLAVAVTAGSAASAGSRWVIRDLGVSGEPLALNDRGQVLGYRNTPTGGAVRAWLWESGRLRGLGTLGGGGSVAVAMNNRGQVVGQSQTAGGTWHAFLWQQGKMVDLGDFRPLAINDNGQVVGGNVLWQKGKLTDLGTLGGGLTEAVDMNERGQIVGECSIPAISGSSACFWQNGEVTVLGGGALGHVEDNVIAVAINARGTRIIGVFSGLHKGAHALLWTLRG